ncbi:SusC/RagA family TonB-linked outer membrane protein [Mangrovibacterium diazotrophicum]|nr:SusC/RagA family TonB-linked outer membrane protein [Mangrovibacterium diazotrophicum]
MKLSFVLIVLSFQLSASSLAQSVTLRVENVTVQEALNRLSRETGLSIVYDEAFFEGANRISVDLTNATIETALERCLENTGYQYQVDRDIIYIRKIEEQPQVSSDVRVSGVVMDSEGLALPGVNILIKGTSRGITTDGQGRFALNVLVGKTLVFRFVGMKNHEITIGDKPMDVKIVMEQEVSELGNIDVISTGYQKIRPEHSTGSVAAIQMKEYDSRINTVDFLDGLQDKIPGLLINDDVTFEGNSLFQIRGISTINGNKDPLIVIDGYPTELSLESINPNEIESVTVLKDAAAASIYGVRASNGVIVIERKNAKPGEVRVDFRSTLSVKPKTNYSRYRWDDDASANIIDFMEETRGSLAAGYWFSMNFPALSAQVTYPEPMVILAQKAGGAITAEEAEEKLNALKSYNNTDDYSRLFLQNAVTQTYNLNISGGNKKTLYYLTANYAKSDLESVTNSNERFSLSGRATFNLSDRLSLLVDNTFSKSSAISHPVPDISTFYPYERFEDEDGNALATYSGSLANPYYNDYLLGKGLMDNMYYPLEDMKDISDNTSALSQRINATLNYKISDAVSLNIGGVFEASKTDTRHLANENSSEVREYVNRYTTTDNDGLLVYNFPKGSFLQENKASTNGFTLRGQVNLNKEVVENHTINMIMGGEIRKQVSESSLASYMGYNDQTLLLQAVDFYSLLTDFPTEYANANPTLSLSTLFNQAYTENRFLSFYSNLVYSFKSKYSLTGSIRVDQSNLFGTNPKYKYKPLWSVGTAWNIHRETFMQDLDWIKSLKLRAAVGFNGNVAKNSLPQIIASSSYNSDYADMETLDLSAPANSKLRWEQTLNINYGLDFSIFKNISGSLEYYIKKSTDVLANNKIDPTRGVSTAIVNESSLRNNGFEIMLHADWITRKRFNWNTGFVFSYNTSKILEVYDNEITSTSKSYTYAMGNTNYLKGYAIGSVFNYRYAGLDSEDGTVLIYDADGNTKHFDENDKGKSDVVYRGTTIPKYNIGLSNRVDVGNFYFYAMCRFYGGFVTKIPVPTPGGTRPLAGAFNFWRETGDELDPDMLPAYNAGHDSYYAATDRYTVNGAYFTLGDLTASYSLSGSEFVRKLGVSSLELRAQAHNVYTFALNDQNYSKAMGSYAKKYITPTYTFALNFSF